MNIENNNNTNNTKEENIESYILEQFKAKDEMIKEKLVQRWIMDKKKLIGQKAQRIEDLQKEKMDLDTKHNKDEQYVLSKRKYNYMKEYVDHCLQNIENQLDVNENRRDDLNWHPNDVELIQAMVAANRHAFRNMQEEESQFQQDLKKQKINKENITIIDDFQKIIYTKKWNTNITINPIIVNKKI